MKVLFFVLVFVSIAFAQTSPTESQAEKEKAQKEREKQVLDILNQAVNEAAALKVAQNRAVVYAIAGDLYWKFDEKRARELFRNSGGEIVAGNLETENEKKDSDDPFVQIYDFNDVRLQILPMIARRDADLALEMLAQTRPAKIAEALAKASAPNAKQDGGFLNFNPDQFRVRQEIALEQQFAVLAAEQNPDKAIKLLKDSLSKGLSYNIYSLLAKINQKDEKKAASLADDVIAKIVDTDLARKKEDLSVAAQFLMMANNPRDAEIEKSGKLPKDYKVFKFSDAQLKTIADKLVSTFMQSGNSLDTTMAMSRVMSSLEKIVPEKAAMLKQKQTEAMKTLPPEIKQMQQREKLWNQNSTPEEILAEIPKLSEPEKISAYQSLGYKISQIDDEPRARKLLEQIPDQKTRDRATEQFESAKISRAARDGKLDEAKQMIANLSQKKTQIQQLVALALQYKKKGGEKDAETAVNLMKDAKNLANEFPEDEDELNNLMEVVKGYAVINPDEGFRIFDPIVDQINDYVQASAILSKYNKRNRDFKKGELLLKTGGNSYSNLLIFRYINQIQMLGKADLNRMNLFANRFARADARTIVKLYVAQGFLKEDDNKMQNNGNVPMIYFEN